MFWHGLGLDFLWCGSSGHLFYGRLDTASAKEHGQSSANGRAHPVTQTAWDANVYRQGAHTISTPDHFRHHHVSHPASGTRPPRKQQRAIGRAFGAWKSSSPRSTSNRELSCWRGSEVTWTTLYGRVRKSPTSSMKSKLAVGSYWPNGPPAMPQHFRARHGQIVMLRLVRSSPC